MTNDSVMDPQRTGSGSASSPTFSEDLVEQINRIFEVFAECKSKGQPYPDLAMLDRLTVDC